MNIPEKLLQSLNGLPGFDREAFEKLHQSGEQVTSIRINPNKQEFAVEGALEDFLFGEFHRTLSGEENKLQPFAAVPWSGHAYYLPQRPSFTFDPLFHAGCYYVQEASSMFLEQALRQTVDTSQPLKVLDLAAAPGGKSTHIQSLITKDSLLVSNDVIRSRSHVLKDNIVKWGCGNVIVTNNDPKDFGRLENFFDVIVVDAPCSGSGLFRRDEEAINEWSENNVELCSQRQQRILADVWPSLKNDGVLIYSTCSYSPEEDENIVAWIKQELHAEYLHLSVDPYWNVTETEFGYRFWPDKVMGEGFFIACLRKSGDADSRELKTKNKMESLSKNELEILRNWVPDGNEGLVKIGTNVFAMQDKLLSAVNKLRDKLNITYFGTLIGDLIHEKLVPAHALAMSGLIKKELERVDLSRTGSIRYLQRKDLTEDAGQKGWKVVTYKDFPLGWINVLHNRINNYYPRELRILKDI